VAEATLGEDHQAARASDEPAPRAQPWGWPTLDLIFGVFAPPLLIVLDPGLFRDGGLLRGDLIGWRAILLASVAIGVPALAWALWLLHRPSEGRVRVRAWLQGVLLGAGACAAALGVLLLPYSLIGALVLIGLLGFAPFVTMWALLRNARRLVPAHSSNATRAWTLLGFVLAVGLPAAADLAVSAATSAALERATSPDAGTRSRALDTLDRLGGFVSHADVHKRWRTEVDSTRKGRLAAAFERLAGLPPDHWSEVD
jgi:hypothetical protein